MSTSRVGRATIESELRRIGPFLREPATLVLFGGCCMSARRIKDTTKDVDAVVYHERSLHELLTDLEEAGYDSPEVVLPGDPFEHWIVLENAGVMPIELFPPRTIFQRLRFSGRMRDATDPWFTEANLEVRLADASTVFLLKSVTGRWRDTPERDIEDLQSMLDQGLVDWALVEHEWTSQLAEGMPDEAGAIEMAREAMGLLEAKGYVIEWEP